MPGHIVLATCNCGYETQLYPGHDEFSNQDRVIAYSKDQSELATFDGDTAQADNLVVIRDPFLYSEEDDNYIDQVDPDNMNDEELDRIKNIIFNKGDKIGTLCPKCKKSKINFRFYGHWD